MIDILNILMITFVILSLAAIALLIKCASIIRQNDEEIYNLEETVKMLNSDLNKIRIDFKSAEEKIQGYEIHIRQQTDIIKNKNQIINKLKEE